MEIQNWEVRSPAFTARLAMRFQKLEGRVIDAAPALRMMLGWSDGRVREFCRVRGWTIHEAV